MPGVPGNAGFPQIGGIPPAVVCLLFPLACGGASETGLPITPLPVLGLAVFGMKGVANASAPQTPTQHPHFWQKPGCAGAIIVTAVGVAATAGEVAVIVSVWPEVTAMLGEAAAEDVLGIAHAGEIATVGLAALTAAPMIAIGGAAGITATCF